MKSAVFQEYIIRIKISKVIFNLKGMKMFFFFNFWYYHIGIMRGCENWKKKKKKKTAQELTLADCAPYGFLH
jgi:hypothetical protein